MNQSMTLPCKTCGEEISDAAGVCPKCGDPHPFCFDREKIIERADRDAKKIHLIKNTIVFLILILLIVLWFSFHKIWPLIVAFIGGSTLYALVEFLDSKLEDIFYEEISREYKEYQSMYNYMLSGDQISHWKSCYFQIYYKGKKHPY